MKLRSLKIEKKTYGDNKGKLFGTLCVDGLKADVTIKLSDYAASEILKFCSASIVSAVRESSKDFEEEFLRSVNNMESQSCQN